MFRRQVSHEVIYKSLIIFMIMSVVLVSFTLLLEMMENQDMGNILFEMTSALGTVGLSMGSSESLSLSASFSAAGKLLVTAAMFFGRLGPITIGLAAALQPQYTHMKYPEGRVSIG
ncbi:TrkH family potassium uptake protein [candidate division FCPU426 bacterium]|nr:TrkH family potassium uptake protein [candidate division FCPU426 bacterium]